MFKDRVNNNFETSLVPLNFNKFSPLNVWGINRKTSPSSPLKETGWMLNALNVEVE